MKVSSPSLTVTFLMKLSLDGNTYTMGNKLYYKRDLISAMAKKAMELLPNYTLLESNVRLQNTLRSLALFNEDLEESSLDNLWNEFIACRNSILMGFRRE